MDNRPISIQHLFEMLKDLPPLKGKVFVKENKLTINLRVDYKIDVELVYGKGFVTYINNKFYYDIEEQDIVDILVDLAKNNA